MNNLSITYTLKPLAELDVIEIANGMRNGQFHTIVLRKVIESKKHPEAEIVKISLISGRFGVDYDNLAETIEERANGKEKGELKGFDCLVEDFLYRSQKNGKLYFRFTSYKNGKHERQYFLNGQAVEPETLAGEYVAPSTIFPKASGRDSIPMFIATDSILSIR